MCEDEVKIIGVKIVRILEVLALFSGGLFVVMSIITTVHAVGRYAFESPIMGQTELVSMMLVIAVSLAGVYTQGQKAHIIIGVIVDRLPKRMQAVIDLVTFFLCLLFSGLAAWQTIKYANELRMVGRSTPTLHINYAPFYYILGIAWALIGIITVMQVIRFANALRQNEAKVR